MSEGELNDANLTANQLGDENISKKSPKLTNSKQAYEVARSLIQDNKKRIRLSSRIQESYDAIKPPFSSQKLAEQGKNHKSNVRTGFMSILVNRAVNNLVSRIKKSKYLTSAYLPNDFLDASEKTEFFRREFTDFIKRWKPFHIFINQLCNETVLHGRSYVVWTNKNDWRPELFRGDKCFIPDMTQQMESPKIVVLKQNFQVNELYEYISIPDASSVGWNIENCIKAINLATKTSRAQDDEGSREFDDIIREQAVTDAFRSGVKEIQALFVFVEELGGKVSQFIVDEGSGDEYYSNHEKFNCMDDVIQSYTYQYGNGTVHGSFGVGQLIYDLDLLVEKTRNEVVDNLRRRGKFNIRVNDEKDLKKAKLMTTDESNILAIGTFSGSEAQIPDASAAFGVMDRELSAFAEQKIGVMMPKGKIDGDQVSATQANIDSLKEEEMRDAITDHFLTQFNISIYTVLKKIFIDRVMDTEAQILRDRMARRLTVKEMNAIVENAPTYTSYDYTEVNMRQKIDFLQTRKNDPLYNQTRLEKTMATLILGKEDADDLIIAERDESLTIVAQNKQLHEILAISQGFPIMAEMSDNDLVHMDVLKGREVEENVRYDGFIFKALENGEIPVAKALYSHYAQHFDNSLKKKTIGERNNEEKHFQKLFLNALKQVEGQIEQAQQQQAEQQMAEQQAMEQQAMAEQQMIQQAQAQELAQRNRQIYETQIKPKALQQK